MLLQCLQHLNKQLPISIRSERDIADSLYNTEGCYAGQGNFKVAVDYFKEALKMEKKTCGDRSHLEVSHVLCVLGEFCSKLGDLNQAIEYYEQALEILVQTERLGTSSIIAVQNRLRDLKDQDS